MKDSYAFYTDKLNEQYRPVFEQVEMYVMVQVVDEPTREERMSELLDSFLSAQEAGKSIQSVVGNDIERFCKTFVADFGLKNSLLSLLDSLKIFAWVFAVFSVMEIAFNISAGRDVWTAQSTLDITGYFLALMVARIICWFINRALRQSMVRTKRVSMKTWRAVIFGETVISVWAVMYIVSKTRLWMFNCPSWVVLAGSAAYLLIYYLFRGRKIQVEKIKFTDMVKEEAEKSFPAEMEKRFEKAQKRSLKRGKELTLEAFLDKEEKDCDRTERMWYFYFILPIPIILVAFMGTLLGEGFETAWDAVLFIVIQFVAEYALMLGLWGIVKSGLPGRRAWIAAKRAEMGE